MRGFTFLMLGVLASVPAHADVCADMREGMFRSAVQYARDGDVSDFVAHLRGLMGRCGMPKQEAKRIAARADILRDTALRKLAEDNRVAAEAAQARAAHRRAEEASAQEYSNSPSIMCITVLPGIVSCN